MRGHAAQERDKELKRIDGQGTCLWAREMRQVQVPGGKVVTNGRNSVSGMTLPGESEALGVKAPCCSLV